MRRMIAAWVVVFAIGLAAWGAEEKGLVAHYTFEEVGTGAYLIQDKTVNGNDGEVLQLLGASPVPEPHALMLQGVGVLALAGLARLRRRSQQRRARSR